MGEKEQGYNPRERKCVAGESHRRGPMRCCSVGDCPDLTFYRVRHCRRAVVCPLLLFAMSSGDDRHDFGQNHREPPKWLFGQAHRDVERECNYKARGRHGHRWRWLGIFDDGLQILLAAALGVISAAALGAFFRVTTFL
ncbi:hypothetical protein TIFTF001_015378 [Ficus carica]|uniref:Uncharacterized protein n=1 Tax=Ficus carica TaxID=3494 RepID=A0AA88D6H5_FICCA|nr:hypothetical protein TIFTF001_015378 [Ficus carica]